MSFKTNAKMGIAYARAMQSQDIEKQERAEARAAFIEMVKAQAEENDQEGFAGAVFDRITAIGDAIIAEATANTEQRDNNVLLARGNRVLTSEETKYYDKLIAAMKSPTPQATLNDPDLVMPKTIIDSIFDELSGTYPLLNEIDFQLTWMQTEINVATSSGAAVWGELTGEIIKELEGSFEVIKLEHHKLSAFMWVAKPILDLGRIWFDRFIRTILLDKLAAGLESAIVDGDGKFGPIGMTRQLSGSTDGAYPRKTAVKLTSIDPASIGKILETISKGRNKHRRAVPRLLMVVNPKDYFLRVYPNITPRATDGTFVQNAMPYPTTIVQSEAVPEGFAVFGLARKYFMGVGMSREGQLEYSDEFRFLQDQRVYRIKLYGNGKAMDENAFVLADISELEPFIWDVRVASTVPEV